MTYGCCKAATCGSSSNSEEAETVNFSYNWLAELVEGVDIGPAALASSITLRTAECEGVHAYAPHLDQVCAARVDTVEPIEGGKNVKAVVDTGSRYGRKTVVCGAPNCKPGIVTAYIPAGCTIGGREIRKAVIGGVESDGMLASGAELGLNRDAAGILELDSVAPGAPLGVRPDHIIEVDNKSLTHRPDLWGHHGMAREVAAILRKPLKDPVDLSLIPTGEAAVSVRIEDYDLCPRYSALVFENVTVQPSPLWLQYRLETIGLNPISNIVDVTNYIMAAIAQPMHAFDAAKLTGGIIVRRAREGERITALNGETYELTQKNLVIADEAEAVAIGGVIGGMDSAIGPETTKIVLESANFQAASIRKTSVALKLRTDASMRFEKAQDPVNTVRGLAFAVALLKEVSPGIRLVGGLADAMRPLRELPEVELPLDWLDRKLGRHLTPDEVRQILEALEFGVREARANVFAVSVPSWRATKDISIKDDLVEEVGRMIGYDSITPTAPLLPATLPPINERRLYHHDLREIVSSQGFHEVYNYSFLSEDLMRQFGLDPDAHVRVTNPIAADQTHLRTTLIPGIWRNIVENSKYSDKFRLFEIGVEIHKNQGKELPDQIDRLAATAYYRDGDTEGLFELKHLALTLAPAIEVRPTTPLGYEHPARTADLVLQNERVGRLFEFHPRFVERGRAAVIDLNLDLLMRLSRLKERRYEPIRRFPTSAFDLSVIAAARALVGQIQRELIVLAGEDLDSIEFVRQYSGPPLPEGMKSVSYRLTVEAPDRTLSSEEVGAIRSRIIEGMRTLGYELRV
jgi:phenylalanyl-tRNA synthetase beta chain